MDRADAEVPAEVRAQLRTAADPTRAAGQQAYMKCVMPFLGVSVPDVRQIACRAGKTMTDARAVREVAGILWDEAVYREERYAAMALLV